MLDVLRDERLQLNALQVGSHLKRRLEELKQKYPIIGDVRGQGLFLGIELVEDRESLTPAAAQASCLIERMREHGVLLITDGPFHNVIKIKPPLVMTVSDADTFVEALEDVMEDDFLLENSAG